MDLTLSDSHGGHLNPHGGRFETINNSIQKNQATASKWIGLIAPMIRINDPRRWPRRYYGTRTESPRRITEFKKTNKNETKTKLGETGRSDDTVQRKHHTRIIVVVVEFCLAVTNFLDLCCCFLCPASLVLVGVASKSRATPTSDRTVTVIVSFRRLSVGLARDGSFC